MAVNFVKFLRTTLCTTTVDNCLWMLRGVVEKNALKIKNSSKKLQQRH